MERYKFVLSLAVLTTMVLFSCQSNKKTEQKEEKGCDASGQSWAVLSSGRRIGAISHEATTMPQAADRVHSCL